MPDSRMARAILPAQMIDEAPAMVTGCMSPFIVMEAKQVLDKGGQGIAYIVWHPNLPEMPVMEKTETRDPKDFIPWIRVSLNEAAEATIFRYTWRMTDTNRAVLEGYFRVVPRKDGLMVSHSVQLGRTPEPPPANNN